MDAPLLGDEEPAVEEDQTVCWSPAHRLVFRLVCAYLVLFTVGAFTNTIWNPLNIWLGVHLFHLSGQAVTVVRTGSGDTALAYVQEFWGVVLAALVSLAWPVVDRKRADYRRADAWLRIFIRYVLGFVLLQYGFGKLFPVQFGTLTPSRLFETYGESSPMGLLWTFMAASGPYTMFAGLMEVIPGVLLLFRRTAVVGALMAAAVMLNVVMLNLCYDVPVKLYSLNLLFMALFLAAPYLYSTASLLVLHRVTTPPSLYEPRFQKRQLQAAATTVKFLVVAAIVTMGFVEGWTGYHRFILNAPKPPLYGAWEVESFTQDGRDVSPVEPTRWKRLMVDYSASLQTVDDRRIRLRTQYDAAHKRVTLGGDANTGFSYSQPDADHLVLQGSWMNRQVVIRLTKVDISKLVLVNRGFHWISQYPYNR